jgi:hypothetical protein
MLKEPYARYRSHYIHFCVNDFQAEATVWRLYPAQSLKGRPGNFSLVMEARDRGQPSLSATATYFICVQVSPAEGQKKV